MLGELADKLGVHIIERPFLRSHNPLFSFEF
jgi:hypothetical protein